MPTLRRRGTESTSWQASAAAAPPNLVLAQLLSFSFELGHASPTPSYPYTLNTRLLQTGYQEHILAGKCGSGPSKGDDTEDDASNLERWENVQHLQEVAKQQAEGPRRLFMPSVDAEPGPALDQFRTPVRPGLPRLKENSLTEE